MADPVLATRPSVYNNDIQRNTNKYHCGNAMLGVGITFTIIAIIAAVALPILLTLGLLPAFIALPLFVGVAILATTSLSLLIAGAICKGQARQALTKRHLTPIYL